MPDSYPWRDLITLTNRRLKVEGVQLREMPVKLKVRTQRPMDDGSYAVDVWAHWNNSGKVSSRSAGVRVTRTSFEKQLAEAEKNAKELVKTAISGYDVKRLFVEEQEFPVLGNSRGGLKREVEQFQEYLEMRKKKGRCREDHYRRQLQWLAICEAYAQRKKLNLSMPVCASALYEYYKGNVSSAAYKAGVEIMRACVREVLATSDKIPNELIPLYRYQPAIRDIPEDAIIVERLMAISDEEERKLIYSIVGYGRRISEIYGVDWDSLKDDTMVYGIGFKNNVLGWSWIMPFGNEEISLKGFKPPMWSELKSPLQIPSADHLEKIRRKCNPYSRLIHRRLGCTATDLRHRWGAEAILNPRNGSANLMFIAKAMHTSTHMLEKTYTKELDLIGADQVRPHT